MLHQAGNEVILIDRWPDHIKAIRENGLVGEFEDHEVVARLPIYSPEEIVGDHANVDLVVALTKSMQLEAMFQDIQPIIGDQTFVFCLLNGLGHEETLAKFVPKENIIFGTTTWTAGLAGPGHAKLVGSGSIEMENLDPKGKAFTLKVLEVFQQAKLNPKQQCALFHLEKGMYQWHTEWVMYDFRLQHCRIRRFDRNKRVVRIDRCGIFCSS